jgi:hypothetical protein
MDYSEDKLVEQPDIQYFHLYDGKSSMFSHKKLLRIIYAIT